MHHGTEADEQNLAKTNSRHHEEHVVGVLST